MAHRTAFSYYGGKGMLASRYPAPQHKTIIEPFAGGAAYSLKYYKHDVFLNDLNPKTYQIWQFILSSNALKYIKKIPIKPTKGINVNDIADEIDAPVGLRYILQSACNVGVMGTEKNCKSITKIGAVKWKHNTINKLLYWWPKLRHWQITNKDYSKINNEIATWFIDPPYSNDAGKLYETNDINYNNLANWCLNRNGFIIVCENYGAKWLPFIKTVEAPGVQSKYRKTKRCEGVFYKINDKQVIDDMIRPQFPESEGQRERKKIIDDEVYWEKENEKYRRSSTIKQ